MLFHAFRRAFSSHRAGGLTSSSHFYKTLLTIITCFTDTFTERTFKNKAGRTGTFFTNIARYLRPHTEMLKYIFRASTKKAIQNTYRDFRDCTKIPAFEAKHFGKVKLSSKKGIQRYLTCHDWFILKLKDKLKKVTAGRLHFDEKDS